MATITITRTKECASKNHITITVTGDVSYTFHGLLQDLVLPITDDEKDTCIKVLLRLAKIGKNNAQMNTALNAGIAVTI